MTTPNRIVFQATGKPFEKGDYRCLPTGEISKCGAQSTADMWNGMQEIAYRRIDAPTPDSRLLEVATALYLKHSEIVGQTDATRHTVLARCVVDARALIAACKGAAQ